VCQNAVGSSSTVTCRRRQPSKKAAADRIISASRRTTAPPATSGTKISLMLASKLSELSCRWRSRSSTP
jgi:hypothetical protein